MARSCGLPFTRAPRTCDEASPLKLREFLHQAPFGLGLSSGFFGFFAHAGALLALEEAKLLPTRVTGSSAGALAGGLWAAGLGAIDLRDELFRLRREDFWDPAPGLGLLRGRLFRARLEALVPGVTFQSCRAELALSVWDVFSRKTRVIDAGPVAPAIQASCTLPGLFQPTWVDGRPLLDGGIADRPGLAGMRPGQRVLFHHLASRSPWRGRASLGIPQREGLVAVVTEGLPRVGPFRLPEGIRAFHAAHEATHRALERPIVEGMVSLDARAHAASPAVKASPATRREP